MMKGVAVKLADEILEEIDSIADAKFKGNRKRAVDALVEKGFDYDAVATGRIHLAAWVDKWESAGRLTRSKWALIGRKYEPPYPAPMVDRLSWMRISPESF